MMSFRIASLLMAAFWFTGAGAALTEVEVRARVTKVERTRSLLTVGRRSIWVDAHRITPPRAAAGESVTVLFYPGELEKIVVDDPPSS